MHGGTTEGTQAPHAAELIAREKVRLAYGTWVQYVDGRLFAVLLVLLMCGLLPELGSTPPLVGAAWLAVDVAWSVAASSIALRYFRDPSCRSTGSWRLILQGIWLAHALIWASAVGVFWDATNPINQAVLCTVMLAVMVSYFFFLAPSFPVLLSSLCAVSAVTWLQLFLRGGELANVFLVMLPGFMLILTNYAKQAERRYDLALRLRFEKEALAAELAKANQAKSSFLASMSHELRTPLNAIIGYADLMRQRTFGPIAPARYATYVDDIHQSGEHLLGMINDLLDLAKIEAGKREYTFSAVNPRSIVQEAEKLVEPQAQRAHVTIMHDLKQTVVLRADARSVKQIITNLLSNAVKYSRPGGIAVVFCEVLPDGRVAFGVKDTGVGMSDELRQRAADPFSQASDAYTVEGRGTGLGLPIVKSLIESHQGELRIESTLNVGSKVWVEFAADRVLRAVQAA